MARKSIKKCKTNILSKSNLEQMSLSTLKLTLNFLELCDIQPDHRRPTGSNDFQPKRGGKLENSHLIYEREDTFLWRLLGGETFLLARGHHLEDDNKTELTARHYS